MHNKKGKVKQKQIEITEFYIYIIQVSERIKLVLFVGAMQRNSVNQVVIGCANALHGHKRLMWSLNTQIY